MDSQSDSGSDSFDYKPSRDNKANKDNYISKSARGSKQYPVAKDLPNIVKNYDGRDDIILKQIIILKNK